MRSWRIAGNEEKYLLELLDGGFPGKSEPNFTGRLEAAFAEKFGTKFAVTFAIDSVLTWLLFRSRLFERAGLWKERKEEKPDGQDPA